MAGDLWTELWSRELDPSDLVVGSIVTFVKAPQRAGEYGRTDALIAGLDRTPLTHAGLVAAGGDDGPVIVHSTMGGVRREHLHESADEHVGGPVFVFAHRTATAETRAAVAAAAVAASRSPRSERRGYPYGDLLIAAILLRLRSDTGFDEHAHRRLARLFDDLLGPGGGGRMCAAFVAEVFTTVGIPLDPPDERTAFTRGVVGAYEGQPLLDDRGTEDIAAGLRLLAPTLADQLQSLDPARPDRDEIARMLRSVATQEGLAERIAAWLVAPPGTSDVDPFVAELVGLLDRFERDEPVPDHLASRFTTVHDIIRSPSVAPVGHTIDWRNP